MPLFWCLFFFTVLLKPESGRYFMTENLFSGNRTVLECDIIFPVDGAGAGIFINETVG
jgi:hypothetical protein